MCFIEHQIVPSCYWGFWFVLHSVRHVFIPWQCIQFAWSVKRLFSIFAMSWLMCLQWRFRVTLLTLVLWSLRWIMTRYGRSFCSDVFRVLIRDPQILIGLGIGFTLSTVMLITAVLVMRLLSIARTTGKVKRWSSTTYTATVHLLIW